MLLLPTTTYRARDFIEAGSRLGIETVVGSDRRQALEEVAPGTSLTLDLAHPETAASVIARFAAGRPLRAVVPTDDATAVVAALASRRLGLPHNPPEAARAARHKDRLRACLQAAGVRTPRHRLVPFDADPAAAAREQADPTTAAGRWGYPCVLKPTFLSASRGVIRADDPAGFVAAFGRILALVSLGEVAEKGRDAARALLVEEFVPGVEVAVEGLLSGGRLKILAIFDKPDPLDGPFFEETIYVTPSRHADRTQTEILATTAAAARALGLTEGPVHAELRVNDAGPCLIEMAARSIGGLCSRTLRFGTGLSLEEVILMHALGQDVEAIDRERQPAGVMMIPIPGAGVLRRAAGLEEARRVPGIVEVTISIAPGSPIVPLPEGSSYLGFLFARGATPAEVERSLRSAHRRLEFEIEST
jgi:biotin carboxylase